MPTAETERVWIATLGKPHGLKGELTLFLRTDLPEQRFAPGASVEVGPAGRPMTVEAARWHSGSLLLRLVGVADRTGAEALRGAEVWARVPADETPADDGEYFDRQLLGLTVLDAAGAPRGTISGVLHNPGQDLLVIATPAGERLVPFVSALVPVVDLEARHVQLAEVGGLLDDLDEASGTQG